MTVVRRALPVLVADGADREAWLAARRPGVTATQVALLVGGGRKTWQRIADEKDSEEESFGGNRHTERGKRREPYIANEVYRRTGILPSNMLYASGDNPRHLATPDCLRIAPHFALPPIGAEIKSTVHDWSVTIPRRYLDQVLWNIHVIGADEWLFAWEPCDEDGQPLLPLPALEFGRHIVTIRREDHADRIEKLIKTADEFLAWRDAGCPERRTELPEEIEEALTVWARNRELKAEAEREEKSAEKVIREYIAADPERAKEFKAVGEFASISYTTDPDAQAFDTEAWARRAPRQHAAWMAAQGRYTKAKPKSRLLLTPIKAAA